MVNVSDDAEVPDSVGWDSVDFLGKNFLFSSCRKAEALEW